MARPGPRLAIRPASLPCRTLITSRSWKSFAAKMACCVGQLAYSTRFLRETNQFQHKSQLNEVKQLMKRLADATLDETRNLNYQTWLSARMSLSAGRIVRSPGLGPAIDAKLNASSLPSYRASASVSVQSVERILSAAASGTPLETANGPILINEDLITATLAGIEGGMQRLEILMNPEWNAPLRHFQYQEMHISILSPWAFSREKKEITTPGGRKGTIYSLSRTVSESKQVLISFSDFSQGLGNQKVYWPDPTATTIRNVQASLDSIGAQGRPPYAESWRGMISATSSGSSVDAEGKTYVSIRNVYIPDHIGFISFIAISRLSLLDSQKMLDEIESQALILS